jgi:hypothetical protein
MMNHVCNFLAKILYHDVETIFAFHFVIFPIQQRQQDVYWVYFEMILESEKEFNYVLD